ncbi:MAG TPA: sugar-binding protein [Candidatus Methylacidiphilales bacterium]|nr:sugar-binding protein [Candidatus Methylacidiphilales bacterium]
MLKLPMRGRTRCAAASILFCAMLSVLPALPFPSLHAAEEIPRSLPPIALPDPSDLVPWPLKPYPEFAKDSAGNALTWLHDAPAGKHGHIRATAQGKLEFEDKTSARFWGTTTVFGFTFPEKEEEIAKMADSIAAAGYNLVRFHHNDIAQEGLGYLQAKPASNHKLNPASMAKLDLLAAELYKRGIYIYLDFVDFRSFEPEDGFEDYKELNKLDNKGWKGVFPHPSVVASWKRAVTEFLNHVNPHTGRKWSEEPGVVTVEIINENGQFWDWNFKLTDRVRDWHKQEWNKWLQARYTTREKLDAEWTDKAGTKGLFADEDPAKGNVFMPPLGSYLEWDRPYRSKTRGAARLNDFYAFLTDQSINFYREAADHIRKQGFKGIVVGSHELQGPINQYAEVQGTGAIAAHLYALPDTAWKARPGTRGITLNGVDVSTNNWFSNLPRIKVQGAPGINGEWTGGNMTRRADVNLAVAAMTAQQGVTQSLHFSFAHRWTKEQLRNFDMSYLYQDYRKSVNFTYSSIHDVPWMAVNRICASLFVRGDFKKMKSKAHIAFSTADRLEQNLHALGLSGGGGTIGNAAHFLPILHEVECVFFDKAYAGDADVVFMTGRSASGDYTKAKHAVLVGDNPYTDIYHKGRDIGLPARAVRPGAKIVTLTAPTTFTVTWPYAAGSEKKLLFPALEGAVETASIPAGAQAIGTSEDGRYALGWLDDKYLVLPNGRAFQEQAGDAQWLYRLYLEACKRWKIDTAGNDADGTFYQSDTKELTIDWSHGTLIVDTDRTQGFSGMMGWRKGNKTKNLEASVDVPYGNVLATGVDGKSLNDSKRILLVAAGRMQNTGQIIGPDAKGFPSFTNTGKAPALVECLRGNVTIISSQAAQLKVHALDSQGRRMGEVPATASSGKLSFALSPKWGTIWFEICTADVSGPASEQPGQWPLTEIARVNPVPTPALISVKDFYALVNKPAKTETAEVASPTEGKSARVVLKNFEDGQAPMKYSNILPEISTDAEKGNVLKARFGKVTQEWAGGFWTNVTAAGGIEAKDVQSLSFDFKGDGTCPREAYLTVRDEKGNGYRSANLNKIFENDAWKTVAIKPTEFTLSPDVAKKNPDLAKSLPVNPDLTKISRIDFVVIGPLMDQSSTGEFSNFALVHTPSSSGSTASATSLPATLPKPEMPTSASMAVPVVADAALKLDGTPDESAWSKALAIDMNEDKVPDWHYFGSHVVNGKRLRAEGATFWLLATKDGLAVTAYVKTGRTAVVAEKPDWYYNDCVEIFTDVANKNSKPDKQLFLAFRQANANSAAASDKSIQIGRATTADGYVLEALVPWTALGFTAQPPAGQEFGLEFQVDFAEPGRGRTLQMVYGTGTNEAWIKSDRFLKLRLQ